MKNFLKFLNKNLTNILSLTILFILLSSLSYTNAVVTSGTSKMNQIKIVEFNKNMCTSNAQFNNNTDNIKQNTQYKMAIVIDDFGSYDQSGVEKLITCNAPLTCAVIPNVDNTDTNIQQILQNNHELILHMPMESHVSLPEDWYGPVYIKNHDSKETIINKLNQCINQFPSIKGFNIHIGSGVSRNKEIMKTIYEFANTNDLYFLDSRTIMTNGTTDACKETNSIYLGRDVFLEADKNKSYNGVCYRLIEGANIAKEKGYSIVIGHVGAEGGENTAKAICDSLNKIKEMGVEIVPLSEIFNDLQSIMTK